MSSEPQICASFSNCYIMIVEKLLTGWFSHRDSFHYIGIILSYTTMASI